MNKIIFHLDMDAFYASIEQVASPQYRNKPVIVGGSQARGVVSACSYEARKQGVHSAMPISLARQRSPKAIFLPVNMKLYHKISKEIMQIFYEFSPDIHPISIDEAFLDMSGTQRLFGSPLEAGMKIKKRVFDQTGLTLSIGIATNHLLAKMASDYNKPDGIFQILAGEEIAFMDQFKLKDCWGIGKKGALRLKEKGLIYPYQIRQKSKEQLIGYFGENFSNYLYHLCNGQDPGIVNDKPVNRSVSNEKTFSYDISDPEILFETLLSLSHQVMFRLLDQNESGKTLCVKIRYFDFKTVSIQHSYATSFKSGESLFYEAKRLFLSKWESDKSLRLIGVGVCSLCSLNELEEGLLFEMDDKKAKVEKTILSIHKMGGDIKKLKR